MKLQLICLLISSLWISSCSGSEDPVTHYRNYTVYRLQANNVAQLKLLRSLEDEVDFWRDPDQIHLEADVMLRPEQKASILALFRQNGIRYEEWIPDVEKLVQAERTAQRSPRSGPSTQADEAIEGFWNAYQRLAQQEAFVEALSAQNPSIVSRIDIGKSYEGRSLFGVRIGANSNAEKPVIFIEGGIHAREWISPATVTYFAQQLVNLFNAGDAGVVDLLNYFDFHIVPVLNADGYEFTHTSTRLWRKTRRPSSSSTCIGADPNRNYGYQWGGPGGSTNPCSETYRGDAAWSEVEVAAERDYILNNLGGRVKSFIAVHSYGQYFLYPWCYTSTLPADDAEMRRAAQVAVAALNAVSPQTAYTIGPTTHVLYEAAGNAIDWSYEALGAVYSYTVELRDKGTYGFQLPASQLVPTAQETTPALIALAKEVKAALLRT